MWGPRRSFRRAERISSSRLVSRNPNPNREALPLLTMSVGITPSGRPAVTGSRWRHAPGRHGPLGSSLSSIGSSRAELQSRTALARRSPMAHGEAARPAAGRTAPGLESHRGHRRGHGAVVGAGVLVGGKGELPGGAGCREVVGAHALAVRVALSHDDTGAAACSVPGTSELPWSALATASSVMVSESSAMSLPATVAFSNWVATIVTYQPTPVPRVSVIEKPLKAVPPPASFAFSVKP